MKLLRNIQTLLTRPSVAWDYVNYQASRLKNLGQAVRGFPSGIQVRGWSGFSEFHSAGRYMNPNESDFLQLFPFESGEFVDVGANLGVISLLLAKRFPSQRIHSFEPNPSTFGVLQKNIALNHCPNIQPKALVVTDSNGEISFNANPINRGTTSISIEGDFLIDLPCTTLDSYMKQEKISCIDFLKVDVEGYEEQVFLGAEELLKQQKIKVIYYEVCPNNAREASLDPEKPTQLLREHGYTIFRLGSKAELLPIKDFAINQVVLENWVALNISFQQKLYGFR